MCTERKATGEYVLACFLFATMCLTHVCNIKGNTHPIAGHRVLVYLTIMIIFDFTNTTTTSFIVLTYSTEVYPQDPVS